MYPMFSVCVKMLRTNKCPHRIFLVQFLGFFVAPLPWCTGGRDLHAMTANAIPKD